MTIEPIEFVIRRHAVPSGANGLSPLQSALLNDPRPIRIASAPTGAGKSFAFQQSAVRDGKRILFIVPTRRLAQNLADAVALDLQRDPRVGPDQVARRLVLWTSDERRRLSETNPGINVGRLRYRQIGALDLLPDEGMMIIATPESVGLSLLRRTVVGGGTDPVDLITLLRLDHVVFDEFHTIDARGFGLAAALALISSQVPGAARITFLSATPIEVAHTLVSFGVPEDAFVRLNEEIVTDGIDEKTMRVVHGDVTVRLEAAETMHDLCERHRKLITTRLQGDEQVVFVFDSVRNLYQEAAALARFFDEIGIPHSKRLAVNSIGDSRERDVSHLFCTGRVEDPMQYKVILATSSIEMGVTFRARLMVMDPGHGPASFVQRVGRVSRGDKVGDVLVRLQQKRLSKDGILRALLHALSRLDPQVPVDVFLSAVLSSIEKEFAQTISEASDIKAFGALPTRSVCCAANFWAAMERAEHLFRGQLETLHNFCPPKAKVVLALLGRLEKANIPAAREWARLFLRGAEKMRTMLPRIDVVEPDGRRHSVPYNIYAGTPELTEAPAMMVERLSETPRLEVRIDCRLEDILGGNSKQGFRYIVMAPLPHCRSVINFDHRTIVTEFLRRLEGIEMAGSRPSVEEAAVIGAARDLVRMTGLVPEVETESLAATGAAVSGVI